MREVSKSALVPYTTAQMFALVEDVERYSDFVPWVTDARVLERGPDYVVARLGMHRAGVREAFTTRNVSRQPTEIELHLVEGPFKVLSGLWTFENIGERGSKVALKMKFEFANPLVSLLLSRTFERSCSELVDAFVARARDSYGPK